MMIDDSGGVVLGVVFQKRNRLWWGEFEKRNRLGEKVGGKFAYVEKKQYLCARFQKRNRLGDRI